MQQWFPDADGEMEPCEDGSGYYLADDVDKRLAELEAALRAVIDDEPCRYDHHGYCQTHLLGKPCEVAEARRLLVERPSAGEGE